MRGGGGAGGRSSSRAAPGKERQVHGRWMVAGADVHFFCVSQQTVYLAAIAYGSNHQRRDFCTIPCLIDCFCSCCCTDGWST